MGKGPQEGEQTERAISSGRRCEAKRSSSDRMVAKLIEHAVKKKQPAVSDGMFPKFSDFFFERGRVVGSPEKALVCGRLMVTFLRP